MKEPIILIGGGGHCLSCIDVIEATNCFEIIGILDVPEKTGSAIGEYHFIGTDELIPGLAMRYGNFHISVGQIKSAKLRMHLFNSVIKASGKLPVIISPRAYVSKTASVGQGSIIMHDALVNAGVSIGDCNIINSKALIEHETNVGDFCHISTGAIINGQVCIGARSFIGSNAMISNNVSIGSDVVISAGSRIFNDISVPGVYK